MPFEVTEKWIGEAAGPRVFREARSLVKLGKVKQLKENNGVFQALVGSGPKPLRVTVKVKSRTEVENLCTCTMARRTGAVCEHAAAVLMESVFREKYAAQESASQAESTAKTTTKQPDIHSLEIVFSPQFPDEARSNILLRKADNPPEEPTQEDFALALWLHQNTGQTGPNMLALNSEQTASFYQAIANHPRISRGSEPIAFQQSRIVPQLAMELDSEHDGEMVWLRITNEEYLFSITSKWCMWDEENATLSVSENSNTEWNVLEKTGITTEQLATGDWQHVETSSLVKNLEIFSALYQLPETLGGIQISEATPSFALHLSGSTRALQAQLCAIYPEDTKLELGSIKAQESVFPIAGNTQGTWHLRNEPAEHAAINRLMRSGFQLLDNSGVFYLRGEDDTLDFLTSNLPQLEKKWRVVIEEKLTRIQSQITRIEPSFEITGSGTDWLACDIGWQSGGKSIDPEKIRQLLQSGSRSLKLPNGKKAVVSEFDADVMQGFLLDTDPRQENGSYIIGHEQAPYLETVQSHYSNKKQTKQKTPIPKLPEKLEEILRPYQKKGIHWLYKKASEYGAALLADDMGLGKTLQTLSFLKIWAESNSEPALVICPATLTQNWKLEAEKFLPDMNVLVMHGAKRKDYFEVMHSADLIITSYSLIDRDLQQYRELEFSSVILDEASYIRNPDTRAAKACRQIRAASRIAISGTPVENSVRDLWSIYQFLLPGYLGSRDDFKTRYELPCSAEIPDLAALERLRWRTQSFMLRRTKQKVAKDLPPKLENILYCEPSENQRAHYQAILKQGVEKIDSLRSQAGEGGARMQMLTTLLRLRQSCCDLALLDKELAQESISERSVKLERLMQLLDEAQKNGHRVLVFSQFTSMLALIRAELDGAKIKHCYLDGSTRDRAGEVQKFQSEDGPPVFLISLKAGGYGLTLTAADTVVLFDPWWNPAVEAQAADRAHRIGQKRTTTIYKFITKGTVEEKILQLQEKKKSIITATIDDPENDTQPTMSGLSTDEMLDILRAQ